MLSLTCLFLALFLASIADAFAAWQPNCTLPIQHINYVSSPQIRGTMEIIWTCFAVLSLCTWTVQHIMVPVHRESRKVSAIRKLWGKLSHNYTKLKWMGLCVALPEYVLGKALTECLAAHDSRRQFKEWFTANDTRKNLDSEVARDAEEEPHEEVWTIAHGFFANMRGVVLRCDVAAVRTSLEPSKPTELGRSRQKLRLVTREGQSPYYEQKVRDAEATELDQCQKICNGTCGNRPHLSSTKTHEDPTSPKSSPHYQPDQLTSITGQQEEDSGMGGRPESSAVNGRVKPGLPRLLTDQAPSQSFPPEVTTSTLVNSPDFSQHDVMAGLAPSTYALGPVMPRRIPAQQGASPGSHRPTTYTTESEKVGSHSTWKDTWALSSMQLLYACQKGIIPGPPKLSTADLEDRSKGDIFVKGAAVVQISWLVIQIVARASENLAVSLLEITTLAFAACAIITYILLWHKPQDVMTPTYVDATSVLTRKQVIGLAARSPVSTLFVHEFWLHGVVIRDMADSVFPWTRGIPIRLPWEKDIFYLNPVFIGIGFGGTLFGTIHFLAWNFEFPTPVERILWRLSCCVIISIPLLSTAMYFLTLHNARNDSETDNKSNALLRPFMAMSVVSYVLARLYLVTEIFRSLAYAPPSTFEDINWPSAIPHVN